MKAFPRDIEVKTLKERHIGIESELAVTDIDGYKVPLDVEVNLDKTGLLQSVGYDGGGREFRTNPISIKSLLKQKLGRKHLQGYYLELSQHTKVIDSGGTHVHISVLDSDHENLEANAVALATAFYDQFQKVAGRKSTWAPKLEVYTFDDVKSYLSSKRCTGKYCSHPPRVYHMKGWILSPTSHKTLEFRGPKGSNNPAEVLAWVDFINGVVEVANRASVNGVKFSDLIKGSYIAEYVKSFTGSRKLSKRDLSKTLNTAQLA